ncbi:hypothetical protein SAMD00019534_105970 [Acytostelium subglobosum LB1]|uniref:hypothetical protein n=1 Tax=Acytostelium subglobosum LB1 TaxID=1410327 RepID=UPI000644FF69|nr:hypothetical protein SAMD00019534_105970 [Acytostelium subglobosum LB1]GAM27421.1 hypothetical protein SAMD00019534_105970 [Acytostelium subglobosum LB1]|eukprot:XP_012749486.1 hypothetical protein SAMD00019534_105970 [Acytostelium subglobosum LB1]
MAMKHTDHIQSLTNVLKACAQYNDDLKYKQPMGYMASVLLSYFDEEETFWMMNILLKEHGMRHVISGSMVPMFYHKTFGEEMGKHFPKLRQHLEGEGVHVIMYAKWIWDTMFVYILPADSISIVWDYFFWGSNGRGIEVLFKLTLAMMRILEPTLLQLRLPQFFTLMKRPPVDTLELVQLARGVVLSDDTIKILRDKHTALAMVDLLQQQQQAQQQHDGKHPDTSSSSSEPQANKVPHSALTSASTPIHDQEADDDIGEYDDDADSTDVMSSASLGGALNQQDSIDDDGHCPDTDHQQQQEQLEQEKKQEELRKHESLLRLKAEEEAAAVHSRKSSCTIC